MADHANLARKRRITGGLRLRTGLLGLMLMLVLTPAAQAFASTPEGSSPHDLITEAAGRTVGLPEEALEVIKESVRDQDGDEIGWHPEPGDPAAKGTEVDYDATHHCGRVGDDANHTAIVEAARYMHAKRNDTVVLARDGEGYRALVQLGKALHALQDCFAHSNVVDLGTGAASALTAALVEGAPAPAGLLMTGIDPDSEEPGDPEGDAYPHDANSKDSPNSSPQASMRLPDGRTKYEAAVAYATEATIVFLRSLQEQAGPEGWEVLLETDVEKPGSFAPGTGAAFAITATAAVAIGSRRRA